ncbi:putative RNA 2'-phosphotransferase [Haloechinothrix alba]|uniref:Probable RNA 2'-phosphotransferase n=1 Tax=Haloechinothrix alba TaxID=664784 RepID=A0A239A5E9_9PSEU|nr:RNA 2'-phosphotransferase [Haloechinothrix alba]SNR90103.1 putative RNA 2'-phosphotransferase [Haloechinothrix alba]
MGTRRIGLSKAVSWALRHRPDQLGLELDAAGWTSIDALVAELARHHRWRDLTRAEVREMVAHQTKQRFEIDGDRIRALYGHSVAGHIDKEPAEPPTVLYHGTSAQAVADILRHGLRPMRRHYVHLSTDRDSARQVGWRKSPDVRVLVVDAAGAYAAGVGFYLGAEQVWLADAIPPRFLEFDES